MSASTNTGHGTSTYDAIVVGGGHNGLTSAAYLAKAGLRTLVLATAFAWSAILVVTLAFTIPGVVTAAPWMGAGRADGWAYVSRHLGPPLLIAVALAPWPRRWDERVLPRGRQGRRTRAGAGCARPARGPRSHRTRIGRRGSRR